jgi:phosphopantothenoylcysteine decarboxylase/phosphopantothenate--cysteine ligase
MWQGRRVVLGVTGGIAAYKSVTLARELALRGAAVDVVLTRGAREFVGAPTFAAVTHRAVHGSLWEPGTALDHLALGADAALVLVAPATAHLLARAAAGLADDFLTTLLLATSAPVLVAPAMNDRMYAHPATTANIHRLATRGWRFVGPATGPLAEGPADQPGRMAEPAEILAWAERIVGARPAWAGRKVVVTAGPTREPIDPVRFVSNRSSGKMGYRLAEAAWRRGAAVTIVSGPSREVAPAGVEVIRVETTAQMADVVQAELPDTDVLLMAAAPADYRPAAPRDSKLPRSDGGITLALEATDDILMATLPHRPSGITLVGFALETGDAIPKARAKLARKQLDLIVVNDALEPGAGFDVETNAVTILDCNGGDLRVPLASKAAVAEAILDAVERFRG